MTELTRRQILATGAAIALAPGLTLIAPAHAKNAEDPASAQNRWGLLIDAAKCAKGCTSCVDACKAEQGWSSQGRPQTDPQWIRKIALRDPSSGRESSLPVMCQHCAEPPCAAVCPTGASFKRADGIVLVDRHICIGCRYCMMACPYKARSFVHEDVHGQRPHMPRGKGTVEGCTLCVHRVDEGRLPACVEKCPEGAMLFGDLNDPASPIAQRIAAETTTRIRQDLGLSPAVHYQGV